MFNDATVNSLNVDNMQHDNISQDLTNSSSGYLGIYSSDITYDLVIESHIGHSDSDRSYIAVVNTSGDVVAMYLDAYVQDFLLLCKNTSVDQANNRDMLLASKGLNTAEHSAAFDNITLGNTALRASVPSVPAQREDSEINTDTNEKGTSVVGEFIATVARFMGLNTSDSAEVSPSESSVTNSNNGDGAAEEAEIAATESDNLNEDDPKSPEAKNAPEHMAEDDIFESVFDIVSKADTESHIIVDVSNNESQADASISNTSKASHDIESGIAAEEGRILDGVAVQDLSDTGSTVPTHATEDDADVVEVPLVGSIWEPVFNIVPETDTEPYTVVDVGNTESQVDLSTSHAPEVSYDKESDIAVEEVSSLGGVVEQDLSDISSTVLTHTTEENVTDIVSEPMDASILVPVFNIVPEDDNTKPYTEAAASDHESQVDSTSNAPAGARDIESGIAAATINTSEEVKTLDDVAERHSYDSSSAVHTSVQEAIATDPVEEPAAASIGESVFDIAEKKAESETTEVEPTHSADVPAPTLFAPLVSEASRNAESSVEEAVVADDSAQMQHDSEQQSSADKKTAKYYYGSDFADLSFLIDEEIGLFGDLL